MFSAFIVFILLFFLPSALHAAGRLDLGFSSSSSSGIESESARYEYSHRRDRIELALDGEFQQDRERDNLMSSRVRNDLQGNYRIDFSGYEYTGEFFTFLATGYLRDTGHGIQDRTHIGAGAGYKEETWNLQSGIYLESDTGSSRDFLIRTIYGFQWPIWGPFEMREKATADVNLSCLGDEDYAVQMDTELMAKLDQQLHLSLGLNFGYDHRPTSGFPHCSRDVYARLGVSF